MNHLKHVEGFPERLFVNLLSSRGLAGVLPPAGHIFEKLHLLDMLDNFQAGC